jgi:hypothetical protein
MPLCQDTVGGLSPALLAYRVSVRQERPLLLNAQVVLLVFGLVGLVDVVAAAPSDGQTDRQQQRELLSTDCVQCGAWVAPWRRCIEGPSVTIEGLCYA